MRKFRKGDQVVVLSGRDKGRQGAVLKVLDDEHVVVEKASTWSSATRVPIRRPTSQAASVDKEMPLHVAKIAIWNPTSKKADRVGFKLLADGKKVRVSVRTERCSTRERRSNQRSYG